MKIDTKVPGYMPAPADLFSFSFSILTLCFCRVPAQQHDIQQCQ